MNREEIRRLQKAAKDNNKMKLVEWAEQYNAQIYEKLRKEFETEYQKEINDSFSNLLIALCYTLYYSEETYINKDNIGEFMCDLFSTIDLYRTGEYKPNDFLEELKKVGVEPDKYDYSKLYEEKQQQLDTLIKEYLDKLKQVNNKLIELDNKITK